jgi:citrate lyase alpha subunit
MRTFWSGSLKERVHSEDLGANGRIVLKWEDSIKMCLEEAVQGSGLHSGVRVTFHGVREGNKPRRPSADIMYVH